MRFSRRNPFRYLLIFSGLLLIYLIFQFASPAPVPSNPTVPPKYPRITASVTAAMTPEASPQCELVLSETDSVSYFPVIKVVDGDTITIMREGKKETIRLIGINTPETVDPRKGVECFGKEASAHAKELLLNTSVRLESDPTQTDQDRYNRSLRYVYLGDGRMVNEVMIEDGFAYEYTYKTPYKYQKTFQQAEQHARDAKKGLWNEATCKGVL